MYIISRPFLDPFRHGVRLLLLVPPHMPTDRLHPHLLLMKTMVDIPAVKPGDFVFWHCNVVHEVDRSYPGKLNSSVSYNACVPLCPCSLDTMLEMRDGFLNVRTPRDFKAYEHAELEVEHADHGTRARENSIC